MGINNSHAVSYVSQMPVQKTSLYRGTESLEVGDRTILGFFKLPNGFLSIAEQNLYNIAYQSLQVFV